VAEQVRGRGLQVEYYGRGNAVFAEQLLTLKPGGRYRFAAQASAEAGAADGSVSWNLRCRDGNQNIANVPIAGENGAARRLSADFLVPQNCTSQWLRLTATVQQGSGEQRLTLQEVGISATGRQ
jgi:hypothetical protein